MLFANKFIINLLIRAVRRFPTMPGRWRLIVYLRRHRDTVHRLAPWLMPIGDGLSLYVNPTTNFDLFLDGLSSHQPFHKVIPFLKPGNVVLDVGANIGITALRFAKVVGPSGRVEAFEAWPPVAAELKRNAELAGALHIRVHESAVLDEARHVDFAPPAPDLTPLASIRVVADARNIKVPALAIDSLLDDLPHVHLVKIDVEGAEYQALCGMRGLLARDHPMLLIEVTDSWLKDLGSSADAVINLVSEYGYNIFEVTTRGLMRLHNLPTRQFELFACLSADNRAVIPK